MQGQGSFAWVWKRNTWFKDCFNRSRSNRDRQIRSFTVGRLYESLIPDCFNIYWLHSWQLTPSFKPLANEWMAWYGWRFLSSFNLVLSPCAQSDLFINLLITIEVNFFGLVTSPLPCATLVSHKSSITQLSALMCSSADSLYFIHSCNCSQADGTINV